MAEFILKDMVSQSGIASHFEIASAATSREEIGNPVHPGTRDKLREFGISTAGKYAVQLTKQDYRRYDYLIGMDSQNIRNMERILGHTRSEGKIYKLSEFSGSDADVADPWYTGDFEQTYADIKSGCEALLAHILPY